MRQLAEAFFFLFAALFPIINPLGAAFAFTGLTRYATHEQRVRLARRVAINSFVIIAVCLFVGAYVLALFGISLGVLRIAGGIVVALTAWQLMNASDEAATEANPGAMPSRDYDRMAFYPLTLPLTTGPGTIAVTIALGSSHPDNRLAHVQYSTGALLAAAAMALIIYFAYRYADRIMTVFGQAVTDAVIRLFAFILFCLGIQIIWTGLEQLWHSLQTIG